MVAINKTLRILGYGVVFSVLTLSLTGCATLQVAQPADIEALPFATTTPYRISAGGRYIIDVSINNQPARPFAVDTGATVSVIYDRYSESINLTPSAQTILITGLVSAGRRPVIEDITFQIGKQSIPLDHVAVLETPTIKDEAVGLIGADILKDYAALFNKDAMTITLIPNENTDSRTFAGWRHIPLQNSLRPDKTEGLYFAQIELGKKKIPVLIDTGSNLNFINWKLATLDENISKLQKKMRAEGTLQGALETTELKMETVFHGLSLGTNYWPSIAVNVMELHSLSDVAPVEQPMMIAGAGLFTQRTVTFDLGHQTLYVRPDPGELRPPSR